MNARVLFFVGKGGVGKSTNSSLFALKLARIGKRVLLNSIDPAHNLHDIFQVPLGSKPKQIVAGLEVMETDLDQWVKKYLKDTERAFRAVYKYQEAFNLHRYFKTLKYSPGLEEYAVLLAMLDTLRRFADRDYIVFDTPPTALTLKFLALPDVSLLWLQELSQFRQLVLDKEQIITRIKQGRKQEMKERDPILGKIADLVDLYRGLSELLKNPANTRTLLVLNPDELSLAESQLIWKELSNLGMEIPYLILNKAKAGGDFMKYIKKHFPDSRALILPALAEKELTGIETLDSVELPLDIAGL
jgi:arsenite/tail-anchored protein-transporting ATPase